MHEYGLMEAIVLRAVEEARARAASSVTRVRVDVGEIAFASPAALAAAFDALSKGSLLEGAELVITEVPSRLRCEACNDERSPKTLDPGDLHASGPLLCPDCGFPLTVLDGAGITLAELVLTIPDRPGAHEPRPPEDPWELRGNGLRAVRSSKHR